MISKRIFLLGSAALIMASIPVLASSKGAAEAFEELVIALRANPLWWKSNNDNTKKLIHDLAAKTGFDALMENTLVKYSSSNVAVKSVTVEKNRIIVFSPPPSGFGKETIYLTVEEAIADIYGINKL